MHRTKKQRIKRKRALMDGRVTLNDIRNIHTDYKYIMLGNHYASFPNKKKLRARTIYRYQMYQSAKILRIKCIMVDTTIKDYTEFHDLREGKIMEAMKGVI